MKYRDVLQGRQWMGRLNKDADLLESFTEMARVNQVRLGWITDIGALTRARLSAYDQKTRKYVEFELDGPLEILNLTGNISMKDGEIFCHIHATLAREDGCTIGGHVCEGCSIFALEFHVKELTGESFLRLPDEDTGLSLWNL